MNMYLEEQMKDFFKLNPLQKLDVEDLEQANRIINNKINKMIQDKLLKEESERILIGDPRGKCSSWSY